MSSFAQYNKLLKTIPDLETLLKEKKINLLALNYPKKITTPWKQYQTETIPLNILKKHDGNYGILLGFNKENSDYWLGGIDIDGFSPTVKEIDKLTTLKDKEKEALRKIATGKQSKEYKLKTRKDLYNLLKDLKDVLIVKTANNGYHLYYWTKKDYPNKFIDNIYYPKDYAIKELKNKPITYSNKHIEHFTEGRQFVAPGSTIEENSYKFISTAQEVQDFFNNPKPKENILNEIKEVVTNNKLGFNYKESENVINLETLTKKNQNNNIHDPNGSVKDKIHDPKIREQLIKNIQLSGYKHGNMNNLGYILICNFRINELNKKEIFEIFKEIPIEPHNLNVVNSWINDKFKVDLDSIDFKKYAGITALMKEIEASAMPEHVKYLKDWFKDFFNKNNYSHLLAGLVTRKKDKSTILNKMAVILKKDLGIKQELEIKGIYTKNLINDYYIKTKFNTMKKVSFEELYQSVLKFLHETDEITSDMETNLKRPDLEHILDYIPSSYRHYNIVTLNNGLYDLQKHEFLNPEQIIERFGEPILTHKKAPFNYNPNAKGKKIKETLRYAFDKFNPNYDPENKEIKGFYEIGGYTLRSGNPDQKIIFMFGVANSLKSTANNLLTEIHGNNISSLALEKYKERFATSALLNVQLNSVRDINNAIIKNNSVIKVSSGNEPLHFEPKGKNHGTIPAIEVPVSVNSGNVLPKFENPEVAILRRLLNLEFKNKVPTAIKVDDNGNVIEWKKDDLWIVEEIESKEHELGTKIPIPYVIKDFERIIMNDKDEMEFLLCQFLEHDKKRINENNHIFSIEKTNDEILRDLELFSNPIETLLSSIIEQDDTIKIEKENSETIEDIGVSSNELFEKLREQARINNVDIPKTPNSLGRQVKKAIKYLFDLDNSYNSKTSRYKVIDINVYGSKDTYKKIDDKNQIVSCEPTKVYPKIKYK